MPAVGTVDMGVTMMLVMRVRVSAVGAVHVDRRVIVMASRAVNVNVTVTVVMVMVVIVGVRMRVSVTMVVVVRMPVMLVEHLLRDREVLGKGRIVTVLVSAAVGTGFGLERHQGFGNVHVESQQHVAQHRIVFELEIAVADFDRGMPVAEVIRRASQCERGGGCHEQHGFGGGFHANEVAVVGHEHVAAAQHRAAR